MKATIQVTDLVRHHTYGMYGNGRTTQCLYRRVEWSWDADTPDRVTVSFGDVWLRPDGDEAGGGRSNVFNYTFDITDLGFPDKVFNTLRITESVDAANCAKANLWPFFSMAQAGRRQLQRDPA